MYNNNMIEYELSVNSDIHSWVIDSAVISHFCVSLKEMWNSSALLGDEIVLQMANEATVAMDAIGTCELRLPSGHILKLDKVLYFLLLYEILFLYLYFVIMVIMYNLMEMNVHYILEMYVLKKQLIQMVCMSFSWVIVIQFLSLLIKELELKRILNICGITD